MNNKSHVRSAPSFYTENAPDLGQLFSSWFLLTSHTGRGLILYQDSDVSVFITVSAVRVAVGEAGVAGAQRFQDLRQLRHGLAGTATIVEAVGAALQEGIDPPLHGGQEFPGQQLGQEILTHHDQAVLLRDGVAGHEGRLAVHSQAAEYVSILLLAIGQLAPCWGKIKPLVANITVSSWMVTDICTSVLTWGL